MFNLKSESIMLDLSIVLASMENCKDFNIIKKLYCVVCVCTSPVIYDKVGKETISS